MALLRILKVQDLVKSLSVLDTAVVMLSCMDGRAQRALKWISPIAPGNFTHAVSNITSLFQRYYGGIWPANTTSRASYSPVFVMKPEPLTSNCCVNSMLIALALQG